MEGAGVWIGGEGVWIRGQGRKGGGGKKGGACVCVWRLEGDSRLGEVACADGRTAEASGGLGEGGLEEPGEW